MYQFCVPSMDIDYQKQRLEQFYQQVTTQPQQNQQWRSFTAKQLHKIAQWLEPTPLKEQLS